MGMKTKASQNLPDLFWLPVILKAEGLINNTPI